MNLRRVHDPVSRVVLVRTVLPLVVLGRGEALSALVAGVDEADHQEEAQQAGPSHVDRPGTDRRKEFSFKGVLCES